MANVNTSLVSSLDIAFVIDATGSMAPVIESTKDHIKKMVTDIKSNSKEDSVIRLAIVAYRDYKDDPPFDIMDFTQDVQTFETFMSLLQAKGGDDCAEDVFTGLEKCSDLTWMSEARMIVHLADAPCHGALYHSSSVSDNYLNGDIYNRSISKIFQDLVDNHNVNTYQFTHINAKDTKQMISEFRKEFPAPTQYPEWYQENDLEFENLAHMSKYIVNASLHSMMSAYQDVIKIM